MKKIFIVANWKSNKTLKETSDWVKILAENWINAGQKEIIVCAPFTLLYYFKKLLAEYNLRIRVGAQNVSPFAKGPFTGEVGAEQVKELADYVLIGHSERRRLLLENDKMLSDKFALSLENNLTPIFIVQDEHTPIPNGSTIVTYEPPSSISPGKPDDPQNANLVANVIKGKSKAEYVLYGGNVTSENVKNFTQQPKIDGVLVGKASLDPVEFMQIVTHA